MYDGTTRGIANKGLSGMWRVVVRFNFSCILIGNRPQSLTGHTAIRYGQAEKTHADSILQTENKIVNLQERK
jgi:hypothetical protein